METKTETKAEGIEPSIELSIVTIRSIHKKSMAYTNCLPEYCVYRTDGSWYDCTLYHAEVLAAKRGLQITK